MSIYRTNEQKQRALREMNRPQPIPQAIAVAQQAKALVGRPLLFDYWGGDFRDNNMDPSGLVDQDDPREMQTQDGQHFGQRYQSFRVKPGTYPGGWGFKPGTVEVREAKTIHAPPGQSFQYIVCADLTVMAYRAAGLNLPKVRSTGQIINWFLASHCLYRRDELYPSTYLPGDFIATFEAAHGGHSAIVVEAAPIRNGKGELVQPKVIEMPGPSTQVSDGTYNPASPSDVREGPWSDFRLTSPDAYQYLGRLR
jgi:hypothetical protein